MAKESRFDPVVAVLYLKQRLISTEHDITEAQQVLDR